MRGDRANMSSVLRGFMKRGSVDWIRASSLPSVPRKMLRNFKNQSSLVGFEAFCRWGVTVPGFAETARRLLIPALEEWNEREAMLCYKIGKMQLDRCCRLDLVRYAYRRALEQWLILDLCFFLEEQGYDTEFVQFCT